MKTKFVQWGAVVTAAAVLAVPAIGAFATVMPAGTRTGSLIQAGPVADNGFPTWYRDKNSAGVTSRVELCLTVEDPLCPVLPDTLPNPDLPVSYPDNFPDEAFYQMASADFTATPIDPLVEMNLEAAYANGAVIAGDEMVFGRIRIRDKTVADGVTWRVTHPYGIDEITASGGQGINMTEDVGTTPGAFGGALASRIGPFLKWDDTAPARPVGYLGDPGVSHTVVGSPYGTNSVTIEARTAPTDPWTTVATTDLFSVQGRYAVNSGVDVERASYSLQADGSGTIDVFASSETDQAIVVTEDAALGFANTTLRGEQGRYFGRVAITGGVPTDKTVDVVNIGDKPVAKKTVKLTDIVTIDSATYTVGPVGDPAPANSLTVTASSSDAANAPVLTVTGFGDLVAGTQTFPVLAPPPTITVTSSRGGSATIPTSVAGVPLVATLPIAAFTAPDTVSVGQPVVMDASPSTGGTLTYDWTQLSGPIPDPITGMGTQVVTFTPTVAGAYEFQLIVTGAGGTSVPVSRIITVTDAVTLTADAGPDQTALRGAVVTLDASATVGANSLTWIQVSGPTVTNLSSASATKPTFTYPLMKLPVGPAGHTNPLYVVDNAPIVFQVTATAADGVTPPATDQVTIAPRAETFTGLSARYRTGRGEWRVSGTSSITATHNVAIVLGSLPTGQYVGQGAVDAVGVFSFRGGATPRPGNGQVTVTYISATGGTTVGTLLVTR